jgi:hypothetical protein
LTQFHDPRLIEFDRIKDGVSKDEFYKGMMGEKDFLVAYNGAHFPGIAEWYGGLE